MRANTRAILADPRFSVQDFASKGKWGIFKFQNPREAHAAAVQYARTPNEHSGLSDTRWAGLGSQTIESFDSSGIAEHPLSLMRAASAAMARKTSRPGKIQPAITGGSWSVPAVLAGLPLAANARARTKLPPLMINLALSYSASVRDETLAPIFAKLARGLWDYTLAGGAVIITNHSAVRIHRSETGAVGCIVQCRVPTNDLAQFSLGLSSAFFRTIGSKLAKAFSDYPSDPMPVAEPESTPFPPGTIFLGGRTATGDIGANLSAVLAALAIR